MIVWLVTIGEPVPMSGKCEARLHRTGQFALWASSQARITWWTSAFDHMSKRFIVEKDKTISVKPDLQIRLLRGCGYKGNISLRRVLDQQILERKLFREMCDSPEFPDIIFCSVPPVELANAAVKYGRIHGVPVVLDMRDMWPDIFIDHAPVPLRGLAHLMLFPLFHQANEVFRKAIGISGITDSFVDWGIRKTGRKRGTFDEAFHFAYSSVPPNSENLAKADAFWDSRGILKNDGIFTVCFFGSISHQFDFNTVFQALRRVDNRDKIRLVVCGAGDKLDYYKNQAEDLKNVSFTGWVDASKIYSLMRRSSVGLDPLPDRYDFLATINNKAVEYLSAGLPVISCPCKGELYELLKKNKCGLSYNSGDPHSLATIFSALIDDPGKIKAMSLAATRCFQEKFALEKIHGNIFEHLKFVAEEYKHTGRLSAEKLYLLQQNTMRPRSSENHFVAFSSDGGEYDLKVEKGMEFFWWRPQGLSMVPSTLGVWAIGWWLFHALRLFKNNGYSVLYIKRENKIVHRSCVIPGYFRWPFMRKKDLQISSTWTDPSCRGEGLATLALRKIITDLKQPDRRFWYVSRTENPASIAVAKKAGFVFRSYASRTKRFGVRLLGELRLVPPDQTATHLC